MPATSLASAGDRDASLRACGRAFVAVVVRVSGRAGRWIVREHAPGRSGSGNSTQGQELPLPIWR